MASGETQARPRLIKIGQLHVEFARQRVKTREDFAVVCPMCHTVQSARMFIRAGYGTSFDDTQAVLGFNCIGRYTGRKHHTPGDPPGLGCDWTLHGFFKIHTLEVLDHKGLRHPFFEPATPRQARQLTEALLKPLAEALAAFKASHLNQVNGSDNVPAQLQTLPVGDTEHPE